MAETTNKPEWYVEVGKPAADSIREMVAALQCDRERLEELRDERDAYHEPTPEAEGETETDWPWANENPEDAAELAELEAACKIDG